MNHTMCKCALPDTLPGDMTPDEDPAYKDYLTAMIDAYVTTYEVRHGRCGNVISTHSFPNGADVKFTRNMRGTRCWTP